MDARHACFILSFVLATHAVWAGSPPEFRGYTKSFFSAIHVDELADLDPSIDSSEQGIVQNRLRIEMLWQASENLTVHAAYDLTPTIQSQDMSSFSVLETSQTASYRIGDLDRAMYPRSGEPEGSFFIGQNLDRLSISYAAPRFDLRLGRQAIAFGAARTINPTDILAPFRYEELDKEEREGVDAIRLRVPLGAMSELDAAAVFGKDGKRGQSAAYGRIKGYWRETDFSFIAMGFRQNLMAGFDLARAAGDAGFFLEAAYTWDTELSATQPEDAGDYARISVGFDTNFSEDFYGSIEYHFNGAGTTKPDAFIDLMENTAYSEGNVFLFGKHFLAPGFSYQITPLWILSGSALVNVSDPSALISPALEYSPKEDVYVQIGAHLAAGPGIRLDLNAFPPDLGSAVKSEFGLYPDIYYTSVRIYF